MPACDDDAESVRSKDSDVESATTTSDLSVAEDTELRDVSSKRGGQQQIVFSASIYMTHSSVVRASSPEEYRVVEDMCEELGITNRALFHSFVAFVFLMLSVQPSQLVPTGAQSRLAGAVSAIEPLAHEVVSAAPFLGGKPYLDGALRSRPLYSVNMHTILFPGRENTAGTFALWSFCDACFRYFGTTLAMDTTLFSEALPSRFAAGLNPGNAAAWAEYATGLFVRRLGPRSSVSALFDPHDGRRCTFAKSTAVPDRVMANSRLVDHLLHAFPLWTQSACPRVGEAMYALYIYILEDGSDNDRVLGLGRQLMLALLCYHLMGRPRLKPSLDFNMKIFCYACKFLFQDHVYLLAFLSCQRTHEIRCSCRCCKVYMWFRQHLAFMGPAPKHLFKALMDGAAPMAQRLCNVLPVWVRMARLFNGRYGMEVDLYAFQALPCFWRSFQAILQRYRAVGKLPSAWLGQRRVLAQRFFIRNGAPPRLGERGGQAWCGQY